MGDHGSAPDFLADFPARRRRVDTVLALSSEKYLQFIQNEIPIWTPVIKAGNIKVD